MGEPIFEFGARGGVGFVEGVDEHEGFFVAGDVAADAFAEGFRAAVDVEQVVFELEGEAGA